MIERIVVMPRWSGTPSSDWYPWLRTALAGWGGALDVLALPEKDAPTIEGCVGAIEDAVADATLGATLLVGHSVGCQAMVRYLAKRPAGVEAAGLLAVAGWWAVDRPWASIVPWVETPVDSERARAAAGRTVVLLSDDDPFTADHEENGQAWQVRMGAEVRLVPGAKHFNGAVEPAVLDALAAFGVEGGAKGAG